MNFDATLDGLLTEAESQPFVGWDFSWLGDRMAIDPLPWDYTAMVTEGQALT